jgi:general secretion pathway protein L
MAVYPEQLCLPIIRGHWSLHLDRERALICMDKGTGFGTELENCAILLKLSLAQALNQPEQLDLYLSRSLNQSIPSVLFQEIDWIKKEFKYNGNQTAFLAEHLNEKVTLNLLQGEYQQVDKRAIQWYRWLPAAALFALLIGINIVTSIIDYNHYKSRSVALNNEIQRVFQETFPEIKRIVDPKVQMEQQLRLLKGDDSSDQASFLTLISPSASTLAKTLDIRLESLSYRDNQLDLKMTLKDLQSLEAIKKKIEAQNDLSVEIKSANASGNQVTSHLRIKKGRI